MKKYSLKSTFAGKRRSCNNKRVTSKRLKAQYSYTRGGYRYNA